MEYPGFMVTYSHENPERHPHSATCLDTWKIHGQQGVKGRKHFFEGDNYSLWETLRAQRDILKISLWLSVTESSGESVPSPLSNKTIKDNREAENWPQSSAVCLKQDWFIFFLKLRLDVSTVARQIFPLWARFCTYSLILDLALLH